MPLLTILAGKIDLITTCISAEKSLEVCLVNDKVLSFFPRKILEFSGEVFVIGEDIENRCIIDLPLRDISQLSELLLEYKVNFSQLELDDFIKNLREVEGIASRLVLKIDHSLQNFALPDGLQHLGKTYMTTNGNGDQIWAATVESSVGLMEWLYSLRSQVEILDPQNIREDFYRYCHYLENIGA